MTISVRWLLAGFLFGVFCAWFIRIWQSQQPDDDNLHVMPKPRKLA